MQTKDHYLLGCFLLEHQKIFLDPVRRNLFLFGCIEPDINPTTYVRGSIKHQLFHGHNAENIGKHIEHITRKLAKSGVITPMQWFRFGTLLHYLADSFTFTHITEFLTEA